MRWGTDAETAIAVVGVVGCLAILAMIFWVMRPLPKLDEAKQEKDMSAWRAKRDQRERETGYRSMVFESAALAFPTDLCTRCGVMVTRTAMHDAFHERIDDGERSRT